MSTFYTEAVPNVKNKKTGISVLVNLKAATCKMDQQKVVEDKHL